MFKNPSDKYEFTAVFSEYLHSTSALFSESQSHGISLSELELLSLNLSEDSHSNLPIHLNQPIELDKFEILEAELRNQGILCNAKADITAVSSLAKHEATFWRWRAKRYSSSKAQVRFLVSVPHFILRHALDLYTQLSRNNSDSENSEYPKNSFSPWGFTFRSTKSLKQELRYLNNFAAYMNGVFDSDSNRYERGLSLLLKILEAQDSTDISNKDLKIVIPISKDKFLSELKAFTS